MVGRVFDNWGQKIQYTRHGLVCQESAVTIQLKANMPCAVSVPVVEAGKLNLTQRMSDQENTQSEP